MNRPSTSPILVCMKWVALRPEIDPLTGSMVTDERWSGPSLADQAALEWALRLAEARATTTHVVTVGTDAADAMLRDALAAGATTATRVHLDAGDEHQATSACVGRLLADVARPLDPAMVLCGDWSLDRGSASVPSFLAAELALDAACGLVRIEQTDEHRLEVERRLDGGRREVLAVTGPAVLSVEGATARLRRAPLRGVLRARTASVRVDWVADLPSVPGLRGVADAGGRLGMTFLPGKQRDGWTGMHWRDLQTDVARLRGELGVDTLLLLVEDHELVAARVPDIADTMAAAGIHLIRFPIVDMHVTDDRDGLRLVLDDVLARLARGQSVAVACRGGMGRTGTIVGCLLRDGGLSPDAAINLTRASRKNTIERHTQEQFVTAWDWPPREALS